MQGCPISSTVYDEHNAEREKDDPNRYVSIHDEDEKGGCQERNSNPERRCEFDIQAVFSLSGRSYSSHRRDSLDALSTGERIDLDIKLDKH